ncbi:MAG: metallophosphoesterase family protein [Bryobacteraceae bacterium]
MPPRAHLSRRFLLAAPLLAAASLLALQDGSASYSPSRLPDRIVANWTAEPSTSFSVTWRTDTSVSAAFAEIVESSASPDFEKGARRIPAATENYVTDQGPARAHSVTFRDLKPSTAYLYRVGDGKDSWSEWIPFRTASASPEPFTFLYFGDAQNQIRSAWSRVVRLAWQSAPDARLVIHAGDLINNFNRDSQWGEWHEASSWLHRSVPALPVPGNHEYGRGSTGERRVTVNWRPQFTLPLNCVPGIDETCYFIDFQGVRFVALNSNEKQKEQAEWLDRLLANNPNRWTIVFFHHPIYSGARNRDNRELRELWQPVFDRHGVDLVLNGHDHVYARTRLLRADGKPGGAVYVVSVSGAKMYGLDQRPFFARALARTQLFQVIRIDGNVLSFEARTARGDLADSFRIEKSGLEKRLIEN